MQIRLLSIGQRMPAWMQSGYEEYARRLSAGVRLELVELPLPRRTARADVAALREREAGLLEGACARGAYRVALDETGRTWSTEQLAKRLRRWMDDGRNVDLLVGGPDGLLPSLREGAGECWSLSPLTFPHGLVRVLVAEQVYRAWTILQGHPYHRA